MSVISGDDVVPRMSYQVRRRGGGEDMGKVRSRSAGIERGDRIAVENYTYRASRVGVDVLKQLLDDQAGDLRA